MIYTQRNVIPTAEKPSTVLRRIFGPKREEVAEGLEKTASVGKSERKRPLEDLDIANKIILE
jgi:hypothetical protein